MNSKIFIELINKYGLITITYIVISGIIFYRQPILDTIVKEHGVFGIIILLLLYISSVAVVDRLFRPSSTTTKIEAYLKKAIQSKETIQQLVKEFENITVTNNKISKAIVDKIEIILKNIENQLDKIMSKMEDTMSVDTFITVFELYMYKTLYFYVKLSMTKLVTPELRTQSNIELIKKELSTLLNNNKSNILRNVKNEWFVKVDPRYVEFTWNYLSKCMNENLDKFINQNLSPHIFILSLEECIQNAIQILQEKLKI